MFTLLRLLQILSPHGGSSPALPQFLRLFLVAALSPPGPVLPFTQYPHFNCQRSVRSFSFLASFFFPPLNPTQVHALTLPVPSEEVAPKIDFLPFPLYRPDVIPPPDLNDALS